VALVVAPQAEVTKFPKVILDPVVLVVFAWWIPDTV
jgi:hypothetical protein